MSDWWRDDDRIRDFRREEELRRAQERGYPGGPWRTDRSGGYARNEGWRARGGEDRPFENRTFENRGFDDRRREMRREEYGARGADPRQFERDSEYRGYGDYSPGFYDRGAYDRGAYTGRQFEEHGFDRNRGYDEREDYRRRDFAGEPRRTDRNWWDRTRDEVGAWFGDEEADRRRRMDAQREGRYRDEMRGDTGWSDPFSPSDRPQDRSDRDYWRNRERDRWDRDRSW